MHTTIPLPRAFGAYLLAVSGAALTFPLCNALLGGVAISGATLGLCWVLAFVAALLPYASGIAMINYRGRYSARFIIGGAMATALAFWPLLAAMHSRRNLLHLTPALAIAGLAAGCTCWLCIRRKGGAQ